MPYSGAYLEYDISDYTKIVLHTQLGCPRSDGRTEVLYTLSHDDAHIPDLLGDAEWLR
jgi:hypothetical protein